jgi:hypothetical protein
MHWLPLTPRKYFWYSFLLEAESTPGPQCSWKDNVNERFQKTPPKIEPATFWLVKHCLNQLCHHVPHKLEIEVWNFDSSCRMIKRSDKPYIIKSGPWERGLAMDSWHQWCEWVIIWCHIVTTVTVLTLRYVLRTKEQLINTDYYQFLLINIYSHWCSMLSLHVLCEVCLRLQKQLSTHRLKSSASI